MRAVDVIKKNIQKADKIDYVVGYDYVEQFTENNFVLSKFEMDSIGAILADSIGLRIGKITPKYKVGRVYCFECIPEEHPDPTIIYSQVDFKFLKPYYEVWGRVMESAYWEQEKLRLAFDNAIKYFVQNSQEMTYAELIFTINCMLQFKNEALLRLPKHSKALQEKMRNDLERDRSERISRNSMIAFSMFLCIVPYTILFFYFYNQYFK